MSTMEREHPDDAPVLVRGLRPDDLDRVIGIDAKIVGRRRDEYFRLKLREKLAETGIKVSLAAEYDGRFAGFLLARVYYGEFGTLEPVSSLDTLGVHPDFRHHGIGQALLGQLLKNLSALRVARLQTEVGWDNQQLLHFFHGAGFRPAPRYCLDLEIPGG